MKNWWISREKEPESEMVVDKSALCYCFSKLDQSRCVKLFRSVPERKLDVAPIDSFLEHHRKHYRVWSTRAFDYIASIKAFLMDPPQWFFENGTLKNTETFASKLAYVITLFDLSNDLEYQALSWVVDTAFCLCLIPWFEALRIHEEWPKPSRLYYPRAGQLGFVDHFMEYLEQLLVEDKAHSIGLLKDKISLLLEKLQFLSPWVMKFQELDEEDADMKDRVQAITSLAYEVEYFIDSSLVGDIPTWCCFHLLSHVLEEFEDQGKIIKRDFADTEGDERPSIIFSIVNSESDEVKVIPIVHNTGTSDHNLWEFFYDPSIMDCFTIRTWSLVSSYEERKKEVFLELLRNASYAPFLPMIYVPSDKLAYMSEDKLKQMVHKLLKDERYFIILEDVWDMNALYDIISNLPNGRKGCRVLLTTPSQQLAIQCRRGLLTSQIKKPTIDDDVVGFKAETDIMLEHLIGESKQLNIISIVGTAGQGKTTLAKKLYSHPLVVNHFDTRAWCSVSQVYEKRDLLLELLGQVVRLSKTNLHKNDEELAEMLYKHLKGQRFLIFLDDMWQIDAWNDLNRCFPNDKNGSRIMFTTRIQELASQAKSDSILQPSLLTDDESWELLEKRLFHKESCPLELLGVGRQIAKNCRGLPLSVVLTAGILGKMEKKVDKWNQIVERLSSHILGDEEARAKAIIELSYTHLPDHSKPCFLYLGAFLEDREISVSKLIRLWIAEGFIKHSDFKSLEDISEDYLTDLIGRSLVTISQEKSYGRIKSCRIHDLLREFCLIKAMEENFLELIRGHDEYFSSMSDNVDYGMDTSYFYSSRLVIDHLHRVCIYSKRNHFIMLKPFGPFVRSLLFFAASDSCPTFPYDISFISNNLKLLKILDLEDINIGDSFKAIEDLVRLRYLAVQGYVNFIPSSISNIWNLETFCVKALEGKVVKVPDSIWDMAKLRHVHINDIASFSVEPHRFESPAILDNMQSFSTPSLAYGDDMEKMIRKLRSMRNLKCIFLDSWDDDRNCNQFPTLEPLSRLVSLKVFYNGIGKYPCKFNFPSNLRKLTLSNFRMPWNEFPQLAMLCNLEVLKLLRNAFEGEAWEMEDEKFPKLKFLKLDTLSVVKWIVSCENLPCLERLLLHKCEQLEEIPFDVGDITTLQMIEVMWCSHPVACSAIRIQEEQQEFGNEGFKVRVHPKVWDYESAS